MSGESNIPSAEDLTGANMCLHVNVECAAREAIRSYFQDNAGRHEIAGAAGPSVAVIKTVEKILNPLGFNDVRAEVGSLMTCEPIPLCIVTWRKIEVQGGNVQEAAVDFGNHIAFFIRC